MTASQTDPSRDQLTGWKEIASFLSKSVRTVQRWEQRYQLPVHRIPGSADVVVASREEIERWKRSEVSVEIFDAHGTERPGSDGVLPALARQQHIRRIPLWLLVIGGALVAFAVLAIHLVGPPASVDAVTDGEQLFDDRPVPLRWQPMETRESPYRQPDGFLVDPGFVTVDAHGVVFDYVKKGGQGRARPYVLSSLQPAPESPYLRFAYVPHPDARISHWVGVSSNAGFVRKGEDALGYWVPRSGVAVRLDRTSKAYVNSRASLWVFEGGEPRAIVMERLLSFQMQPGQGYACSLAIEGDRVWATVSDGRRTDTFTGTLDKPIRADEVFISDGHDGVSALSPPGLYRLRFNELSVVDLQYRVDVGLLPATSRAGGPANARAVPVAIDSNPNVDATSLDQRSLRMSDAAVLPGDSNQGFACRRNDLNGDGVFDLVCDFDRQALKLDSRPTELVLRGRTLYGRRVGGRLALPAQ